MRVEEKVLSEMSPSVVLDQLVVLNMRVTFT
jgi:hypothetical protein